MFDTEFFPTPSHVAKHMLHSLKLVPDDAFDRTADPEQRQHLADAFASAALKDMLILDPSAGSGALLDAAYAIMEGPEKPYGRRRFPLDNLHAVEHNPDLQAVLKEKKYQVVGSDFLQFHPTLHYDLILMNPPFSNGDEHLLHAWDIMREGRIVCLLNAQTIRLPHTERRKRLKALIEQHGTVEYMGPAFAKAERPTNVDVAMVTLKKVDHTRLFDFLEDDTLDRETEEAGQFAFDEDSMNSPVVNDVVKVYVEQFNAARAEFVQYMKARHRMKRAARLFHDMAGTSLADSLEEICRTGDGKHQYNAFTTHLQQMAWNLVFNQTHLHDLMTATVRNNFERMKSAQGAIAFTEPNIHALFEMLFLNRYEIIRQGLVDAFDKMTRYHRHNQVDQGWATNDAFKVNRKVIMPAAVSQTYAGRMEMRWDYRHTINDVDRALAMLNGKRISMVHTVAQALEKHFASYTTNGGALENNTVLCEHFRIRFFKKGTIHLHFLDDGLWNRFNIAAAQGKQWLPMDYEHTPQKPAAATQLLINA